MLYYPKNMLKFQKILRLGNLFQNISRTKQKMLIWRWWNSVIDIIYSLIVNLSKNVVKKGKKFERKRKKLIKNVVLIFRSLKKSDKKQKIKYSLWYM